MILELLTGLLRDSIELARQDFFSLSRRERELTARSVLGDEYPEALVVYFASISPEQYERDALGAVSYLRTGKVPEAAAGLLLALNGFLVADFGFLLDGVSGDFYSLPVEDRLKLLSLPNVESSQLYRAAYDILVRENYHSVASAVQRFVSTVGQGTSLLIQIPRPMSGEDKKTIRQSVLKSHPDSFLVFAVEPSILGGLRFFEGGVLRDASWLSRIKTLSTR